MASHVRARRRVVVLNQYAKPPTEPGGTRHVELFGRLTGWQYRIVAGDRDIYSRRRFTVDEPHFTAIGVSNYHRNDYRRVLSWISYCFGAFFAAVGHGRPTVVYASSPHLLAPVAGWCAARLWRARFVLEIRDLWPQSMVDTGHLRPGSRTHRLLSGLETWLYRRADRIVIVTSAWRDYFESLGIDRAKLAWISNSAEPADFTPRPDLYPPLRERVPVTGKLLVYAGAHGPANGLDQLLDVAGELTGHTFVLIGDGLEKHRLVARARDESLTNVYFLDLIPKRELAGIIAGADIGVHVLADVEVFQRGVSPNKLYDYMAAGLPVVTNCLGEPHDVVADSGAGVAVGPRELVIALRKLVDLDAASLADMGRQGRRYIDDNRSRTVMAARLQCVLDDVAAFPARVAASGSR